jgi:hypothetical protein
MKKETVSMQKTLAPHPRLYIGKQELARITAPIKDPRRAAAVRAVRRMAAEFAKSPVFEWERNTHNAHLLRARHMQTRIVTLLVEWQRTGFRPLRDAAVAHVRAMGDWEYWSWIAWRQENPEPKAIFDLSYGENSATLALAYDLLVGTLSPDERRLFLDIARHRALAPCLHHTRRGHEAWWLHRSDSNWLSVCAGGAGMLALAMWEELPEARRLLPRLDGPLTSFMAAADKAEGGWYEGMGYWNYGMRYEFMYLLSHERATGSRHPALALPGARQTLSFPLDFTPNSQPCGFGDINGPWQPLPFHFAAAERLRAADVLDALHKRLQPAALAGDKPGRGRGGWPLAAEYLLLSPPPRTPATRRAAARRATPVLKLFRTLDWGYVADRMPDPGFYVSVRAGSTQVPHAHLDPLSWHAVINKEQLVTSISNSEYIDTTFSDRRFEVFEMSAQAKNTILIGGVGLSRPAEVPIKPIRRAGLLGFHLDASQAIRIESRGQMVAAVYRAFLMIESRALLIVDRVMLRQPNRVESRFHTFAGVTTGDGEVRLHGTRERLVAAFGASVPLALRTATDAPTTPRAPAATLVRAMTEGLHQDAVIATLLVPGSESARVTVDTGRTGVDLHIRARGFAQTIRLTTTLMPRGLPGRKPAPQDGHTPS